MTDLRQPVIVAADASLNNGPTGQAQQARLPATAAGENSTKKLAALASNSRDKSNGTGSLGRWWPRIIRNIWLQLHRSSNVGNYKVRSAGQASCLCPFHQIQVSPEQRRTNRSAAYLESRQVGNYKVWKLVFFDQIATFSTKKSAGQSCELLTVTLKRADLFANLYRKAWDIPLLVCRPEDGTPFPL